MTKGSPPNWRRRDCTFDHLVAAAIEKGYGKVLIYSGIESFDRADQIRRGIYRCSLHRGIAGDAGPSGRIVSGDDDQMGIRKTGSTYELRYRVWTKAEARKSHLRRYGSDRSAWPYDPRRPATADERASWANRNERGEPVNHSD